jgi:hypothetical protein
MATSVPPAGRPFIHLSRSANISRATDAPKEDDVDDTDADEDEDDEDTDGDGKKTKKSKKTKKAEDDCDESDDDKPDARAIRVRENARVRTILNSAAGRRLPDAARHLAFNTRTPRWSAVKLLKGMNANMPQGNGGNLRNRMSGVETPDIGDGGARSDINASPVMATAAAIIAAGKKRRGEV